MPDLKYVAIEGNIGAGKTTLAKKMAEEYNANLILEQFADNPFLPKFYENPDKYSFHVELSFLASRYKQLVNELPYKDLFKTFTLADFYFAKSLIFARATLSDNEFKLYREIFNIIYKSLPSPDLFVYLHQEPKKLKQNIIRRGRKYEQEIEENYLQKIQDSYFKFMKDNQNHKYIIIDLKGKDFISHDSDYEIIKSTVFNKNHQKGMNYYRI
ncbi:MAG: deoxynucleoside kinase [Bacteroidota bacterium]